MAAIAATVASTLNDMPPSLVVGDLPVRATIDPWRGPAQGRRPAPAARLRDTGPRLRSRPPRANSGRQHLEPGPKTMTLIDERQRRIVTTHVGSLPRPDSLSAKLFARMTGQPCDAQTFAAELRDAVRGIVRRQGELGIDVASDGEFSKISFQYYVTERLGGIEPITPKIGRAHV